jgi:hypothetical protein
MVTGKDYACAITENGTAKCWGNIPLEKVREISDVASLSIGRLHAFVLLKNGTVKFGRIIIMDSWRMKVFFYSTSPIGIKEFSNVIAISTGD